MSLRRLLAAGISAAPVRLRFRSLSTAAASHPPWALVDRLSVAYKSKLAPPTFHLAEPPRYSFLQMPLDLTNTSAEPGPDSDSEHLIGGVVSCSSGADGLLLVLYFDARLACPILAQQGDKQVRHRTGEPADGYKPVFSHLVCNPLSGQVSRLPNIRGTTNNKGDPYVGLLTQAGRYGLPERFAVARLCPGNKMIRFLSHTGRWELAECHLPEHPLVHGMGISQETLAFGGRLWWADLSCGAISVDPFSDRTDIRFVEVPKGSVLPKAAGEEEAQALRHYRRMGVVEGRLRYAEVSQREPFVLSSFALDEEGVGDWTLEHRVALSRVWAADGGGHPWLPLQGKKTPQICVLDPVNANIIHLSVGEHVVAVDMDVGKVIGSSPLRSHGTADLGFMPCVLRSGLIPSIGNGVSENQSFAHVRVHSNSQWEHEVY